MYNSMIDILDERIKAKLEYERNVNMIRLQHEISQCNDDAVLNKLKHELYEYDIDMHLGIYMLRTRPIINEYQSLKNKPKKLSFKQNTALESDARYQDLYKQYCKIAEQYIDINDEACQNNVMQCKNCNSSLINTDDGIYVCEECGVKDNFFDDSPSFKDVNRVNMFVRYKYKKKSHFQECIDKYQNKQKVNIPDKVYIDIKELMKRKGINTETVTIDHITTFIKELGYKKYKDASKYIYYVITNKEHPNIAAYEEIILDMFNRVIEEYESMKQTGEIQNRSNFLNVNYILYQLLRIAGYNCSQHEFPMIRTPQKIKEHDEMFEKICNKLGWIPYPIM